MATSLWSALGPLAAPAAVLDLDARDHNIAEMTRRAAGVPIRVASKSIRVRGLIAQLLGCPGYAGVLAYSAAEAKWLAEHGVDDVVVGYPTVDTETVAAVAADPDLRTRVTFMADLPDHLRLLADAAGSGSVRVCLDVDSSLDLGPVHLGVRRSAVHTAAEATVFAEIAASIPAVDLVGMMFYDAQIAGMQDTGPMIRAMKKRSLAELTERRQAVHAAVAKRAPLEFVNAGGTGSLHLVGGDVVTELTAGSGLFAPSLFDGYDDTDLRPAAYFASPVVRKPRTDIAVTFSGGYIASGPAGKTRVPRPVHPEGLALIGTEGAGEVQTPLQGKAAEALRVGDTVWFRHGKAGEMCERFDEIALVRDGVVVDRTPTYRGEGRNFG